MVAHSDLLWPVADLRRQKQEMSWANKGFSIGFTQPMMCSLLKKTIVVLLWWLTLLTPQDLEHTGIKPLVLSEGVSRLT